MSVELNVTTGLFELLCDECGMVINPEVAEDFDPEVYCEECQQALKEENPDDEVDEEGLIEEGTKSDADPGL